MLHNCHSAWWANVRNPVAGEREVHYTSRVINCSDFQLCAWPEIAGLQINLGAISKELLGVDGSHAPQRANQLGFRHAGGFHIAVISRLGTGMTGHKADDPIHESLVCKVFPAILPHISAVGCLRVVASEHILGTIASETTTLRTVQNDSVVS